MYLFLNRSLHSCWQDYSIFSSSYMMASIKLASPLASPLLNNAIPVSAYFFRKHQNTQTWFMSNAAGKWKHADILFVVKSCEIWYQTFITYSWLAVWASVATLFGAVLKSFWSFVTAANVRIVALTSPLSVPLILHWTFHECTASALSLTFHSRVLLKIISHILVRRPYLEIDMHATCTVRCNSMDIQWSLSEMISFGNIAFKYFGAICLNQSLPNQRMLQCCF